MAVAREIKAKENVLLSDRGPGVEAPESVIARSWRMKDGHVHILIANPNRASVRGMLKVAGRSVDFSLDAIGAAWLEL